jgi:hypothetical protein
MLSAKQEELTLLNLDSRPVWGALVGSCAAAAMAIDHQPLIWVAITWAGGFLVGCITARGKTNA